MSTPAPRHAGPSGPPLTVPALALFASGTTMLAGGWLVLAPFALGYQPAGADWADPTIADFTTGLVLLVLGAIATVVFAVSLVARLRPVGARPVPAYAAAPVPAPTPDDELVALLKPLVAALARDDAASAAANGLTPTDSAVRS